LNAKEGDEFQDSIVTGDETWFFGSWEKVRRR